MATMMGAREFEPVAAGRGWRIILGVFLSVLVGGGAIVGAAVFWLPHSIAYEVTSSRLTITARMAGFTSTREVRLEAIAGAHPQQLSGGRKRSGSNLPGYCVGTFSYRDVGTVWQATDCGRTAVVIHARGMDRPMVVSPQDREAFLDALGSGSPGSFAPTPVPEPSWWLLVKLLMLVPLALAALVPVLFFVAPGRLRYLVGQGQLEVRTMWGRKSFDLTGVRVSLFSGRVGMKVIGSAMPGYYTGWFMVGGKRTRVYASRVEDGLLLENGQRVFITPVDAREMLDALAAEGAPITG